MYVLFFRSHFVRRLLQKIYLARRDNGSHCDVKEACIYKKKQRRRGCQPCRTLIRLFLSFSIHTLSAMFQLICFLWVIWIRWISSHCCSIYRYGASRGGKQRSGLSDFDPKYSGCHLLHTALLRLFTWVLLTSSSTQIITAVRRKNTPEGSSMLCLAKYSHLLSFPPFWHVTFLNFNLVYGNLYER